MGKAAQVGSRRMSELRAAAVAAEEKQKDRDLEEYRADTQASAKTTAASIQAESLAKSAKATALLAALRGSHDIQAAKEAAKKLAESNERRGETRANATTEAARIRAGTTAKTLQMQYNAAYSKKISDAIEQRQDIGPNALDHLATLQGAPRKSLFPVDISTEALNKHKAYAMILSSIKTQTNRVMKSTSNPNRAEVRADVTKVMTKALENGDLPAPLLSLARKWIPDRTMIASVYTMMLHDLDLRTPKKVGGSK